MKQENSGIGRKVLLLIATCLVLRHPAFAQKPDTEASSNPCTQEFEVATIKPHPAGGGNITIGGPPGKYQATNVSAKLLVEQAFSLPDEQVTGGPPWVESQSYDVNAKVTDDCWQHLSKLHKEDREKAMELMLQSLLKERFKLTISHHPKELMVYALVVARGGSKLRPAGSPKQDQPSGSFLMGVDQRDAPIGDLARFLSGYLGRTVVDGTGLTGRYDVSLLVPVPEQNTPDASTTALFQALQDQLGLKLVSRREVVDSLVIDHLEQPSEN
jgi:uncharacterized protein (TIGR03435 family)